MMTVREVSSITGLLGGVGQGLMALVGPGGTVVAVLAAIAAGAVIVYQNWDKIKAFGERCFQALQPVIEMFSGTFTSMKDTIVDGVMGLYDKITTSLEPIGETFNKIKGHFEELAATPAFQTFITVVEDLFLTKLSLILNQVEAVFTAVWNTVVGLLENSIGSFMAVVNDIMGIFDGLIQFITGVFTGNWEAAWEGVKTVFSNAFNALVDLAKTPINAVIAVINGALSGLNSISVSIPSWVPGPMSGKSFGLNIPLIPELYVGTDNWKGGLASINERGGEIVDLPRGARVYPHDKSVKKAYADGAKNGGNITIAKLADTIVVREQADIDRITAAIVHKLEMYQADYVGG